MNDWIRLVGPRHAVEIFGIRLVGVDAESGKKLGFTVVFGLCVLLSAAVLRRAGRLFGHGRRGERVEFWTRQAINLFTAVVLVVGLMSIWFDDPGRLATGLGFVTAGLAVALQKVVTAIAGYFVILRGRIFKVGDRIVLGGVRGDVIALDFTRTTIMEMGQPPPVQGADPAMWVRSRQYTGRVVAVTNATIFDEPVYNYTRDFPYIWEELVLPVPYAADRERAESILLSIAERHTLTFSQLSQEALAEMQRRYVLKPTDIKPSVYYRLTDNWLELTVRFVVEDHDIRAVKDAMSRDLLKQLDEAGIGVASETIEIAGVPTLKLQTSA